MLRINNYFDTTIFSRVCQTGRRRFYKTVRVTRLYNLVSFDEKIHFSVYCREPNEQAPGACPMKIRVYAASFCSFEDIDADGYMELPEGAVLDDVYDRLQVPWIARTIVFATVNYRKVGPKTKLQDGDVVSFFSALGGG